MRGKNAFGGCTCCGNTGCAWLVWDVIDATGPNTGNDNLIPSGGGYRDADGWLLEPGSKLKTATQSPFVRNGQAQVSLVLPVGYVQALDFSAYGPEEADWKVRLFFESDEAEQNYKFFDIKIIDLGWSLYIDGLHRNYEYARLVTDMPTTRAIKIECGKRVAGVDQVLSSMINEPINSTAEGDPTLNDNLKSIEFALSRMQCDADDRGFCFEGYNVIRLDRTHSTGDVAVNRPLTGLPNGAVLLITPDALSGFSPVRQFDGFDPAAGFGETLTDPAGTYAGVQRLGTADIPIYVTDFNVGKYEKGYAAAFNKPAGTENILAHPAVSFTGAGAAYAKADSVFGFITLDSLSPSFAGTFYGKITYDSSSSPHAFVTVSTNPAYTDALVFESVALLGSYVSVDNTNFRFWVDPPSVDGVYPFEMVLSSYPSINHFCFVWPMGYQAPCSEQALINFNPTVTNSIGSADEYHPSEFPTPDPDVTYAPGRVAIVGNWRTGIISGFTENMYFGDPIGFPAGASEYYVLYRVGVRALLSESDAYIPPNKVYDLNEVTELTSYFGIFTAIHWDFASGIWKPKHPGEPGFLTVWVEVYEFVSKTTDASNYRRRYYGFFGAVPLVGDTIDCDGLTVAFNVSDKKAYAEQYSVGHDDFSAAQFSSVSLDFFSI